MDDTLLRIAETMLANSTDDFEDLVGRVLMLADARAKVLSYSQIGLGQVKQARDSTPARPTALAIVAPRPKPLPPQACFTPPLDDIDTAAPLGPKDYIVPVDVPAYFVPGQVRYITATSYICNPLHRWFPVHAGVREVTFEIAAA